MLYPFQVFSRCQGTISSGLFSCFTSKLNFLGQERRSVFAWEANLARLCDSNSDVFAVFLQNMFMHVPQMMVLRLHDWTTWRSCGKYTLMRPGPVWFQDFCKSTFRENFHETVTDLNSSTPQTFAFQEAVDPVPNTLPYIACTLSTGIALLWLLGTLQSEKADWMILFERKKDVLLIKDHALLESYPRSHEETQDADPPPTSRSPPWPWHEMFQGLVSLRCCDLSVMIFEDIWRISSLSVMSIVDSVWWGSLKDAELLTSWWSASDAHVNFVFRFGRLVLVHVRRASFADFHHIPLIEQVGLYAEVAFFGANRGDRD